jgi:hypothetical protein
LPGWLQAGVVVLLLVNGVQTAFHVYSSQASGVPQIPPPSSPQKLSGFEYTYQPDRLVSAAQTPSSTAPQARYDYNPYGSVRVSGNMQPTFQYSGYFAHAPSAGSVTPMRAYDVSVGRWTERKKEGSPWGPGTVHNDTGHPSNRSRTFKACPETVTILSRSIFAHLNDGYDFTNLTATNCTAWADARLADAGLTGIGWSWLPGSVENPYDHSW